jgi:hypothetical protein
MRYMCFVCTLVSNQKLIYYDTDTSLQRLILAVRKSYHRYGLIYTPLVSIIHTSQPIFGQAL